MAKAKTKTTKKKKTAKKTTKKTVTKKASKKKAAKKRSATTASKKTLNPKANAAVKKAADAIWAAGLAPHTLLQELHEVLLLKCLKESGGNYAAAASKFGPSRQSVQQYANSPLRDDRWKPYQQNRRKKS